MIRFLSKRALLLLVMAMHGSWGLTLLLLPFPERWASLTPLVRAYGQDPIGWGLMTSAACTAYGVFRVYLRKIPRHRAVLWIVPQEMLLTYMALWQLIDVCSPPTITRDILVLGYSLPIFLAHTIQMIDFYRQRPMEQEVCSARR